jgi:hypothetical protein
MGKAKRIVGTVSYQDIGTGFWGITDTQGNKWRPVNMPEQLKVEGSRVRCTVRIIDEDMSIHMWGEAVKIIAFQTPTP